MQFVNEIREHYTERMGICTRCGGLSEAQAHAIASAEICKLFGAEGAEWLRVMEIARTFDADFTSVYK